MEPTESSEQQSEPRKSLGFTAEELEQFAGLYEEEFGEKLSQAEASAMVTELMQLLLLFCKPLPLPPGRKEETE